MCRCFSKDYFRIKTNKSCFRIKMNKSCFRPKRNWKEWQHCHLKSLEKLIWFWFLESFWMMGGNRDSPLVYVRRHFFGHACVCASVLEKLVMKIFLKLGMKLELKILWKTWDFRPLFSSLQGDWKDPIFVKSGP